MTTWVFQGNPEKFDIDRYLAATSALRWTVRQKHLADRMMPGDRVFIWRAEGDKKSPGGVVAAGRLTSLPTEEPEDPAALQLWTETPTGVALRVRIDIDRVADQKEVVKRDWLKDDPILSGMRILKMANETNYELTVEEAQRLEALWLNTGRDWNPDESMAGLWAYSKTYAGEVSRGIGSPVSEVAIRIGRAVTGVYNKVMNFRALDPRDERDGLSGGGAVDEQTWAKYYAPETKRLDDDGLDRDFRRRWPQGGAPPATGTLGEAPIPPEGQPSAETSPGLISSRADANMQVFATREWGFNPERWPVISFALKGDRDALVRDSRSGDLLLVVGTASDETAPEDRGRLLGLAEIGRTSEVETIEAVDPSILKPAHFNDQKEIRWPKGLAMLRAWRFIDPPLLVDVLKRQLHYGATVRAVLLDEDDTRAVLALPKREVPVRDYPAIARLRAMSSALQGATTGPRPSSWTGETGRNANEPAFTYAFQFGRRDLWKIGHAKNVAERLVEVSKHVPHEVLRETWQVVLHHRWATEGQAYDMEQRLLSLLRTPECVGERVLCTRKQLDSAWQRALTPLT